MPVPRSVLVESLWHLDAASEQKGWGHQAPTLLVALDVERPDELGLVVPDGDEAVALAAAPLWSAVLSIADGETTKALALLAVLHNEELRQQLTVEVDKSIPSPDDLRPPYPVLGVFLVAEAWMARYSAAEPIKPPSRHPDRFEVRVSILVTPDGDAASLYHERDGIAELAEKGRSEDFGGRLVDALRLYLAELRPDA
jgi:hypothetical protein